MNLNQFLSTLKTAKVNVIVKDSEDNEVCVIQASSVTALADDLESRIINRWYINGATSLIVYLNDASVSA